MQNQSRGLIALILVLFLDGFGQGVIYPVLAATLDTPNSHVLIQGVMSLSNRELLYGLILAIYFFTWFFGAAILGDISDNIGRKRALVVVLGGMVIGNILSGLAFVYGSIWLLIFGRVVVGFTAGSQAIAQAAIADISTPENQARNTGFVMAGVMIGFVAGPLAGGYLSNPHLASWFSDATPIFLAGLLSLVNVFLIIWLFSETRENVNPHRIRISRAVTLFVKASKHRELRVIIPLFLLTQFGWVGYFFQLPTYWMKVAHGTEVGVGISMSWIGLGLAASMFTAVPLLEKHIKSNIKIVVSTYILLALFVVMTMFSLNHHLIYALGFLAGYSIGTGYTFFIKIFSSHASKDEQGWVMGVMNSCMVLATGVSSLVCGWLVSINIYLPFGLSAFLIVLGIAGLSKAEK